MFKSKTVLVTGGAGYIGSVLVRQLLAEGYRVRVLDILAAGGEALLEVATNPRFEFLKGDVRDASAVADALKGCWGVAHLAGIVGDPACRMQPELTRSVNITASEQLYDLAEKSGCERFVFSSTCSNYGRMTDPDSFVDESSELAPVSLYAETKVHFEGYLLGQHRSNRCLPTCLRFSTVYGFSPRVRFDLTVNEFTRELSLGRELAVFGEQFWRPYCHVEDLAASVCLVLRSSREETAFEVFNVGDTSENYTKKMIVEEILTQIPTGRIQWVQKKEDPRDYRVNFDKIKGRLGFQISRRVPDGIAEIHRVICSGLIANPDDKRYSNV
ncbi:MAG: NAD-dependent epimerase/dehydratase family protein [Syntrophobacteraceae bacterium]